MNKVSCVILTKNSLYLEQTLSSVGWCDEILIIDDFSETENSTIKYNARLKVYKHSLQSNFAMQREWGMSKAKNLWVLFVDSDEFVSTKLRNEIQKVIKDPIYDSYKMPRKNVFLDKELVGGEWGQGKITRLVKKSTGKWTRAVHEYWLSQTPIGQLKNNLLHYSPMSIGSFVKSLEYFPQLHALEKAKEGKSGSFWKIIFYPPGKFIRNYILRKGYKDGIHGFVMSSLLSFHSFLSWCYLWSLKR